MPSARWQKEAPFADSATDKSFDVEALQMVGYDPTRQFTPKVVTLSGIVILHSHIYW